MKGRSITLHPFNSPRRERDTISIISQGIIVVKSCGKEIKQSSSGK